MNILLTGMPHVGKSTTLSKLLANKSVKKGFVTTEIVVNQKRTGFEMVSSEGKTKLLASVDSDSCLQVSKYGVEIEDLNQFLKPLFQYNKNTLLYIDEIGQMQLFSEDFKALVKQYLDASNLFVGTLSKVYHDEFTHKIKTRNDVEIIDLTVENRIEVYKYLSCRIKLAKF